MLTNSIVEFINIKMQTSKTMPGSRKYRQEGVYWLVDNVGVFININVFPRGCTDLLREAIRPVGPNCFSRGARSRIDKETCCQL